ncbi:MAG: ABC transporter permease [Candidatus Saccharibacteria bacterium]
MNFFATFKLVIRSLLSRKGRSFLTILGIVIGVAGVIIIIALGAGAQALILGQVTKLGSNMLAVMPGKTNESGAPASAYGIQITTLVTEDAEALQDKSRVPHATAVAGAVTGSGTITWHNQEADTNYVGTQADYSNVVNINLTDGRFFDQREETGAANVIVIGSQIKEDLFGETNPIGQIVKIKSVPFMVIGVIEKRGSFMFTNQDNQVYMPLKLAQTQLLGIHHLVAVYLKVDSAENMPVTTDEVTQILKERHNIKRDVDMDFTVRNLADAIKVMTQITDALRLFLVAMAAISLIVGGVGILNIMLVTVAERTREIGLRKAVGATNGNILKQFLFESGLLTLLGGIVGIIVGILVSFLAYVGARAAGLDWAFIISPISVVLSVGISILTGVVFGLYPAYKASRLSPIEALRYE